MYKLQVWNNTDWVTILLATDIQYVTQDKTNRQLFAMVVPAMRIIDQEGNEYGPLSS